MTQPDRHHHLKSCWSYLQQALVVLSVVMLVLSPLAVHDDAHAGHVDQHMSISLDGSERHHDGQDDDDVARCRHPAAGCTAIVLTKPFAMSEPTPLLRTFCRRLSELWQGRQAQPKLRPPIL